MMVINGFLTEYMQSYCYLISEGNKALIIDPCENDEITNYINGNKLYLEYCFLTHEHYDHISGLDWIHSLKIPVIVSCDCDKALKDSKKNQSRYYESFSKLQSRLEGLPIPHVDEYVGFADSLFQGEEYMEWEGHSLYLRQTPGHSEGSICILIDDTYLFSGDTIFLEYDTNTKIPGGSRKTLERDTMPWIRSLNDNIHVYPGHYVDFIMKQWREKHDSVRL